MAIGYNDMLFHLDHTNEGLYNLFFYSEQKLLTYKNIVVKINSHKGPKVSIFSVNYRDGFCNLLFYIGPNYQHIKILLPK